MQEIVFEKPYSFIPPHRGNWWPSFIQRFRLIDFYLRRYHGVVSYECRGTDNLRRSLDQGYGIVLTPNHCRPADPIVMGFLARRAKTHVYAMAGWHLYQQHWFTGWAIRKMGGFSIYREGIDRKAINTSIEILGHAQRPLIIFPEGAVTRTNDRLQALLDGVAFIARAGAKKRSKVAPESKVVLHPVALKYLFQGDLAETLDPVLTEIEHRLSWRAHRERTLLERIGRIGRALLALKELEYFGAPQTGSLSERLEAMIDRLLGPLEGEWLGQRQHGPVVPRVKELRMKILPDMVRGGLSEEERQRRWDQLADIYLCQQVASYPPDYLVALPSVDRLLETVERYEEDLTDRVRVHGHLHVVIQVAAAIEVPAERDRQAVVDPLMTQIESVLQRMLDDLAQESPVGIERPSAD
jgi:1-acyl-sn-glycerol-3-phosphate acyltransferase